MAFAVLSHSRLLGSSGARGRVIGYGGQASMISPGPAKQTNDQDQNTTDSGNPTLDLFNPAPQYILATLPVKTPEPVIPTLYDVDQVLNQYPDPLQAYPTNTYVPVVIPQQGTPISTPSQPYPVPETPIAAYYPVDDVTGVFNTGNTGPAILTSVTTQGAGTPTGANASLVTPVSVPSTQIPIAQLQPGTAGTMTLFGYTAPTTTWLVIGVVAAFALSSLLGDSGSTRRR